MKQVLIFALFTLVLLSTLILNLACQTNSSNPTIADVVGYVDSTPTP